MNPNKAYIVNTGIICAIGRSTAECAQSLKAGKSGISKMELVDSHWKDTFPVGEIKLNNRELAAMCQAPEQWPRTALLSLIAVKEALAPVLEKIQNAPQLRLGLFSANTVGGMDLTESVYGEYLDTGKVGDTGKIKNHECGAVTDIVAQHMGIFDFVTTISTACSSSANSIMMASQMLENGQLDIAVAGGADSLCKFTINGFNTLMILDKEACQPFDENRRGLNLGEAAAYVLLVRKGLLNELGLESNLVINGYANANDAYHQTASSPEGIGNTLAMQGALNIARLAAKDIDYINLHGTGTQNNDSSEGIAIENIFKDNIPPASSTKAYTGHTLGAAAAVEAVFCIISLRDNYLFPTLRLQKPIESLKWQAMAEPISNKEIKHIVSNSFGFGGNCSSLVLSKI